MWFFPTKKELKKEFEKIKDSFKERDEKINQSFKERDLTIEKLKERVENNSLKIATLEGSYLILSQKSQSQVSSNLKQSQAVSNKIETKLIQRIRNNKKSLVMAEIMKLINSYSVIEMFEKIVREKGLCSKASFYRYIESLKSQSLIKTETELRLKGK